MKKIRLLVAVVLLLVFGISSAYTAPPFTIYGQFSMSTAGLDELVDLTGLTEDAFEPGYYTYGGGLEINFAPIKYVSLGLGGNYLYKGLDFPPDLYAFGAIEPYAITRFFIELYQGVELFVGGGAGYLMLFNSNVQQLGTEVATLQGSTITYKAVGGISYTHQTFVTMFEAGYKGAKLTPFQYTDLLGNTGTARNDADTADAYIDFGGLYFKIMAGLQFGAEKKSTVTQPTRPEQVKTEMKEEKTQTEESEELDEFAAEPTPVEKDEPAPDPTPVKIVSTPEPEEYAVIVDLEPDDTEGIIILSPGESEIEELEKYIISKRKVITGKDSDDLETGEEEITFEYDEEDAGIIMIEAKDEAKIEKAGLSKYANQRKNSSRCFRNWASGCTGLRTHRPAN